MLLETVRQKDLERVDALSIIEAVAYANRVSSRLKCNNCTDEERKNGLELLRRLTVRVSFLKITLEPEFSRIS
jgi:hypothetical protein